MQRPASGCLHTRALVSHPAPTPSTTPRGAALAASGPGTRAAVPRAAPGDRRLPGVGRPGPGHHGVVPGRDRERDTKPTCTWTPAATSARRRRRCGTPTSAWGRSPTRTSGTSCSMGPFYWVLAELHVPLWVAQRLWMSALLFAAGAGALYLCRTLGLGGPGWGGPLLWPSCSPPTCCSTRAGSR